MFYGSAKNIKKHGVWRQKTSLFTLKTIELKYDANI